MNIKIEGLTELLNVLKGLYSGLKDAVQISEGKRKEMREALADTAELIDETLSILKQQMTAALSELKYGDKQNAKYLIYALGNTGEWEQRFRQFQLCERLREATLNLDRKGLFQFANALIYGNQDVLSLKMHDYLGGEANAAQSVAVMLQEVNALDALVDSDLDKVVLQLEQARSEVGKWRQSFIDLEQKMRNAI